MWPICVISAYYCPKNEDNYKMYLILQHSSKMYLYFDLLYHSSGLKS